MCGEAAHGRQRADVIERRVQPRRDMAAGDRGPVPRDRPGVPPVANAERLLQRGLHPAGKLRAGMILAQVATPSQQMRETGLMRGRGELAIRRPPIAHQHAGVLGPEDAGGLGKASAGLNGIHRRLRRGEGPQPVAAAVDPPARFIRRDHGTATNRLAQSDVGWPRLPGRPMQGAGHGARGDRHTEPIAQQRGDLAMRQPELFIELHHQRHGLRAELHTSRAQRIRGLQRMPALQAPPAGRTPTDRHVEATDEGPHIRELFLILRGDAGHLHRPGTMRTCGRQADRNHVVDRRRPRPLAMPSIVTSGSPSRPARMTTRRALRERGRRLVRRSARQVESCAAARSCSRSRSRCSRSRSAVAFARRIRSRSARSNSRRNRSISRSRSSGTSD